MAKKRVARSGRRVSESTGNVCSDLGLPEAGTELAKAQLAHWIVSVIEDQGLTQRQAAGILGIDQPAVSHLVRGNLERFSLDRLFRLLNALGRDVEIVVKPAPRSRARASVRVVAAAGKKRRSA